MWIYRLISLVLLPFLAISALWRVLRGVETTADLRDRVSPRTPGPGTTWVHGASVGELKSARPVIEGLDGPVLVTSNTTTGRDTALRWGLDNVTVTLAPLDFAMSARRMAPPLSGLIILENELWPNRIATAHRANVPVILLSARMSRRARDRWRMVRGLTRRLLAPVALAVPQDQQSGAHLQQLGLPPDRITGPVTLKSAYAPDVSPLPEGLWPASRDKTILAAATHAGEEAIALNAFATALETDPELKLIIAPRHPHRAPDIARLIAGRGLSFATRSKGEAPEAQVYLADTLDEMSFWYRLSGVALIGGSLVDQGGHSPYEPAAYGCPILHGPFTGNFVEIYKRLGENGAAIQIKDANDLAAAFLAHGADDAMAKRARQLAQPADLAPIIARIKALLI